jgi:hypothetical protein
MNFKNIKVAGLMVVTMTALSHAGQHSESVGSTLNNKFAVELADVPVAVKRVIKSAYPKFKMQEAEKEFKHGNTYFDIEGLDENGDDLEFDMLLGKDGTWTIAEIQRDLSEEQCPKSVIMLFRQQVKELAIARIIESDQGDGVVIYEFYTIEKGQEKKYEIKRELSFLEKEWTH